VPARFWYVTLLCLAVLTSIGLARWGRRHPGSYAAVFMLASAGLVLETWPARFPLHDPPERIAMIETGPPQERGMRNEERVPLLELPPGPVEEDAAAMYRAILHQRPLINGTSANAPWYYRAIVIAFQQQDSTGIEALAEISAFDVLLHREREDTAEYVRMLEAAGARHVADEGRHTLYHVAARPPVKEPQETVRVPLRPFFYKGYDLTRELTDDVRSSAWFVQTLKPEDVIRLDLELQRPCPVEALVLEMVTGPRSLTIMATGTDGSRQPAWSGALGGPVIRGALRHTPRPRVLFPLDSSEVSALSLEFHGLKPGHILIISEIEVLGPGSCR
jgi:hypothetical protein